MKLEASNVFGGPAVTEQPAPAAPAPAPVPAPEPTQAAPAPAPQATPPEPQAPTQTDDPVLTAINDLRERVDSAIPQTPAEPEPAVDLLAALEAEPEQPAAPQQQQPPAQQQPGYVDPEAEQQLAALQSLIDERARETMTPWIQQQRVERIEALGQKYPDITSKEVLPELERNIADLIQRTGNDDLRYDDRLVEKIYKMVKAEQAEAGAVPAEQVATQGASLETNAGNSQTGAPSDDDQYKSLVYGTPATRSVFGGG